MYFLSRGDLQAHAVSPLDPPINPNHIFPENKSRGLAFLSPHFVVVFIYKNGGSWAGESMCGGTSLLVMTTHHSCDPNCVGMSFRSTADPKNQGVWDSVEGEGWEQGARSA